jgi:hypothetical protein
MRVLPSSAGGGDKLIHVHDKLLEENHETTKGRKREKKKGVTVS